MHTRDPTLPYQPVDNPYFYAVQPYHKLKAIVDNRTQYEEELSFRYGDVLSIDKFALRMESYYKSGYRYAKLAENDKIFKFLNFKVEEYVETYKSLAFE